MRMGFIISSGEPSQCVLLFFSFMRERNKCCGCILKHGIKIYYLNLYYQIIELVDADMWNNFICLVTREIASCEDIPASVLLQVT